MSSETLRIVEGLPGGQMRCGEAGAPPGSMQGSRVLDAAAVGQALRQLVARTEITTSRALIAAGDAVASFRVITFPRSATDADIDAAVKSQLDLGTNKMAHRYLEVPVAASDERAVFAAVWDRAQVVAIADAIRLAGLEPAAVDLKSLFVVRADPALTSGVGTRLEALTARNVLAVDPPPRVDPVVRYVPYLTCLGLILRRSG